MTFRWTLFVSSCLVLQLFGFAVFAWPQTKESAETIRPRADEASGGQPVSSAPVTLAETLAPSADSFSETRMGFSLLKNIVLDQTNLWTSPRRLRFADANWLIPLASVTAASFAVDAPLAKALTRPPTPVSRSATFSNYGIGALGGMAGGLFLLGRISHDGHKQETGLLAAEAAVDAVAVTTPLQYAFGRLRPHEGTGQGPFWRGGSSFPSDHSAAAWALASVVAHEYPGPLTQLLAYGLASAVSVSRVSGGEHFPSDVVIGGVIGWFAGQRVFRAHHDPELGGDSWGSLSEEREPLSGRNAGNSGSPYVPLDSWIYPAIDRLAALGYIHSSFEDVRPWTRLECSALVQEAGDALADAEPSSMEAAQIYQTLEKELRGELATLDGEGSERLLRIESVYTSVTGIAGAPLNNSDHFGETIINNFGRPYQEGVNTYAGFSGYGTAGRFTVYVRGEFQHSPAGPAYSLTAREAMASADGVPLQPATAVATANQFRLLDTYVAVNVGGCTLSAGKQSLWWGVGQGGALLLSDNAEPIYMFRAAPMQPFQLPWILRWLGPAKTDFFFGALAGNQFPARPLIHGEKISFKPAPNLELSLVATSEFGGAGRPVTPAAVFNSFFSVKSSDLYAANDNPGKRTLGFDFAYAIPQLGNWLQIYDEALLPEDNPTLLDMSQSPLYAPRRAAMRPGLFLSHLPGAPRMDLRVEAVYTDPPTARSVEGRYIYWNDFYRDLYVNQGNLIGDWIGREGMGFQGWSTYWFSPRNSIQFGYRHAKVAGDFVPGGETLNDGSLRLNWQLRANWNISAYVQYEKWRAPILAAAPQTNWTSALQVQFTPRWWN